MTARAETRRTFERRERRRSWPLVLALGTSFFAAACRNRGNPSDSTPAPAAASHSSAAASASGASAESGKLPEDPEAGARSVAEWREHLQHEERERRLGYDRRKLHEHEEVLKELRAARRSFDDATTKPAVFRADRAFQAARPKLDAAFDAIDHWGNSSKVLPDYRKLVETFSDAYPGARMSAIGGDAAPLERVGREVDERFRSIEAWLHEAEESEDE